MKKKKLVHSASFVLDLIKSKQKFHHFVLNIREAQQYNIFMIYVYINKYFISLIWYKNISVILVYPIPEVGFDISTKLRNKFFSNKLLDTSFDVFKERTKSSFELLDSIQGENIYRVYPHTLFCDTTIKNRCVAHDDKNIFYSDDNHPSIKASEMINDLIIKEIEKIELKSN